LAAAARLLHRMADGVSAKTMTTSTTAGLRTALIQGDVMIEFIEFLATAVLAVSFFILAKPLAIQLADEGRYRWMLPVFALFSYIFALIVAAVVQMAAGALRDHIERYSLFEILMLIVFVFIAVNIFRPKSVNFE
jgi:hypothetical protein